MVEAKNFSDHSRNGHLLFQISSRLGKNAKIWAKFHLCPEVKYAFTSFHETAFLNNFL
jgi:hypothetical protein